jgi:hypothetical protein
MQMHLMMKAPNNSPPGDKQLLLLLNGMPTLVGQAML